METIYIIILVIIGLGAFKGYSRGFIVEILSFAAFFIGLFLALELTIPVSKWLFGGTSYFEITAILVFIGLFLLLSLAIKAGAKALKSMIDMTIFGSLDNLVGAFAGAIKWAFVISIVFWLFESVGFDIEGRYADDAVIFPYIVDIGPTLFNWLSQVLPFIKDLIDSLDNLSTGKDTFRT